MAWFGMVTNMTQTSNVLIHCKFQNSQILVENSMCGTSAQETGNLEWVIHSRLPLKDRME